MKIVVCIKQVPDTADIKWTENNTIQREGVESVINPFDEYALEAALRIKDKLPETEVIVISMGPMQAEDMLRKALAIGADKAYLLSDRKFAGADTIATSKTIAAAIRTKVPDADLIICGQFAIDGDTGQTGPSIANFLNLSQVTYVQTIDQVYPDSVDLSKETENTLERLNVKFPAVLCVLKAEYDVRAALLDGYVKAQDAEVEVLGLEAIGLPAEEVGLSGSPTYVGAAFRPPQKEKGEFVQKNSPKEYAEFLNNKMNELRERFGIYG